MEGKKYLLRLYKADKYIQTLEDELLMLDTIAKGGAIDYSESKVQTSNIGSFENVIHKIVEIKSEINDKIREKLELIEEVSMKISEIDDHVLESILRKRYIKGESWEKISSDLGWSVRKIYKLHKKALDSIEKYL
ncbi:DUF1492 domain-containing protein [Peptostreptococcus sp. D1]|uniref:DUF1492 domain-containing protein n=1 Tax=Peptostreptococcus sp. D1 TaxID=72304 RepID=UPI0008E7983E|nr:DUF1492 domain-containing protein [Peptostreptococcus sp. D1]SFE88296.1 Protein of unknown function [Peptostreptococcus sp. D1]